MLFGGGTNHHEHHGRASDPCDKMGRRTGLPQELQTVADGSVRGDFRQVEDHFRRQHQPGGVSLDGPDRLQIR
jgi:hypothetical protein